jgi:hypothetical protein|nr:MAG TPA: hypothetical protein [Caudoviricetes sp.]
MKPITIYFKRVYFEDGNSFAVANTASGRRFILEDIANILGIDINYAISFIRDKTQYFAVDIMGIDGGGLCHCIELGEIANLFANLPQDNVYRLHYLFLLLRAINSSMMFDINTKYTSRELVRYYVDLIASARKITQSNVYTMINERVKSIYKIDIFKLKESGAIDSIPDYIEKVPSMAYNILFIIINLMKEMFNMHLISDYNGAMDNGMFEHGISATDDVINRVTYDPNASI